MSDLTQPPHVPSCVSTGEGVTVPTATATPRTDNAIMVFHHCAGVDIELARTLERELAEAKAEVARMKASDEFNWNIIKGCMDELEMVDMGASMIRGEIQEWKCSHDRVKAKEVAATDRAVMLALERDQLRAALDVAEGALKSQRDWWHQLPGGIYENPDIEETSPEDASAHVGGLAVAELDQALARIAETRKGQP